MKSFKVGDAVYFIGTNSIICSTVEYIKVPINDDFSFGEWQITLSGFVGKFKDSHIFHTFDEAFAQYKKEFGV